VPAVGSWGYYMQGNGRQEELEQAGSQLSLVLNCPVHYPAYGKRVFECKCGVTFPRFAVEGALQGNDWSLIIKQHVEGYRPEDVAFTVGGASYA
jgi:hypothetical protein